MRLVIDISAAVGVRQARMGPHPQPVWLASAAELGGAHGIAVRLREDGSGVNERDLRLLRDTVTCDLHLVITPQRELVTNAVSLRPERVILVPESYDESAHECLALEDGRLADATERLRGAGIAVSGLFPAERDLIARVKQLGFDGVELSTSALSAARGSEADIYMQRLANAGKAASRSDLFVSATGGLTLAHLPRVSAAPGVDELRLGHAIVARALFIGLTQAVKDALALLAA